MEDKGRYTDSIFVERLWRSGKYEEVYLKAYFNPREARAGLDAFFHFYNTQRPHQALGYRTPAEAFNENSVPSDDQSIDRRWSPGSALVILGKMVSPNMPIFYPAYSKKRQKSSLNNWRILSKNKFRPEFNIAYLLPNGESRDAWAVEID